MYSFWPAFFHVSISSTHALFSSPILPPLHIFSYLHNVSNQLSLVTMFLFHWSIASIILSPINSTALFIPSWCPWHACHHLILNMCKCSNSCFLHFVENVFKPTSFHLFNLYYISTPGLFFSSSKVFWSITYLIYRNKLFGGKKYLIYSQVENLHLPQRWTNTWKHRWQREGMAAPKKLLVSSFEWFSDFFLIYSVETKLIFNSPRLIDW